MTGTSLAPATAPGIVPPPARPARRIRWTWRPSALRGFVWLYLLWSLAPVALAILFSFNNGSSVTEWQGFSLRWYVGDPYYSVLHDPTLHAAVIQTVRLAVLTTVIAVPIGVLFAIGVHRWRSRQASAWTFLMLLAFVMPELIFGVGIFLLLTNLLTFVRLGTTAQVLALVAWNISWPAIIVRARLQSIGDDYEEAAKDLGASSIGAVRRVLLPMLFPAVFASVVLVFAGVIDDFVIVDLLSSNAQTQPMSVIIYTLGAHGGSAAAPALNALATVMFVMSIVTVAAGWGIYRLLTRGERDRSEGISLGPLTGS
jgi:spermidine/putrescine transport system permease protein